ncbi:MFS transporter [Nonomuraea sp. NPDC050783]|uniref:MFS transporter n=1 Tax=Nonomuraea sp. NPDC050783 TaxID=3154634 RepID=UPI003465412A
MTTTTRPPDSGTPDSGIPATPAGRRALLAVGVTLLATFMDLLDATIVGVAIPRMQRDLFAGNAAMQWVVAAYVLAFAVLLVIGGRLGDIHGRKKLFLGGVAGFTLASVACALAMSPAMLIGARAFQGAAAAIMIPQVLSMIRVDLSPAQRGPAYALYGAVTSLATVMGPIVGGLLVEADLFGQGWRTIFLINVPAGLFTFVAAAVLLRDSRERERPRLDLVGVVLLAAALMSLLYPLVQGHETGWPLLGFVAMACSVPLFAAFARYERHRTARDGFPLVALTLFRRPAFTGGLLLSFLLFSQVSSFFFVFVIHLQTGLGFSPLRTGVTLLWWSAGVIAAGALSVRLAPRLGRRLIGAGSALTAAGMAAMSLTLHLAGPGITSWVVGPAMILTALGVGAVTPVLLDTVIVGVPERDAGAASGVINTMMQVGAAAGVAVVGAVFFTVLSAQATGYADALVPRLRAEVAAAEVVPARTRAAAVAALRDCVDERVDTRNSFLPPPACFAAMGAAETIPPGTAVRVLESVDAEITRAREEAFTFALKVAVWYHVLASLLGLALIRLLPAGPAPGDPG